MVGEKAQLVVWSGDPLEVTSLVEAQWLNGEPRTLNALSDGPTGPLSGETASG
jgi:imidazolonepropionase-like amidohydrolase